MNLLGLILIALSFKDLKLDKDDPRKGDVHRFVKSTLDHLKKRGYGTAFKVFKAATSERGTKDKPVNEAENFKDFMSMPFSTLLLKNVQNS